MARRVLPLTALAALGCASASPMLAPARVLREGRVAVDVGSAYNAPVWAPELGAAPTSTDPAAVSLRTAVAWGATPPGVMSYVAGRGGFGHRAEGSIALVGRVLRIGARRELWSRDGTTLTGGLAGRFAFLGGSFGALDASATVSDSRLYGGEATLALGASRRDVYDLWAGLRVGYLYNDLTLTFPQTGGAVSTFDVGAHRLEAALNVGMRIAFGRFGAAVELEAAFSHGFGSATSATGAFTSSASALALVPAAALSYQF